MDIFLPTSETGGEIDRGKEHWEAKAHASSESAKNQIVAFEGYFSKLSKRTKEIDEELTREGRVLSDLKRETDKKINYVLSIAVGIIVIFFLTGIPIFLDYWKYNEERYEKFIDKTQEIRQDVYTKADVNSILKEFKDCIWFNGLSRCLK